MKPVLATALRRTGATVSALLVLAAAGGAAYLGVLRPGAAEPGALPPERVAVGAADGVLVCPGPPRLATALVGEDLSYDEVLGPGPEGVSTRLDAVVVGPKDGIRPASAGTVEVGQDQPAPLTAGPAVSTGTVADLTGPWLLRSAAADGVAPFAAATTLARADSGDLRGLAAQACQVPTAQSWLVAGSTEVGSSARLVLTNPGLTPVTAVVSGWSTSGPVGPTNPILVAPGESRAVLLETLVTDPNVAFRVDADGGQLTASMQDSRLDGLVPAGLELVGATASPATELSIGPFPIVTSAAEGVQDEQAQLRLVNPGAEPATVAIDVLGSQGESQLPGAQDLVVEAGAVANVSLAGLDTGTYGVRITSDHPVTGAVQLARTGTPGEADPDVAPVDVAWVVAQPAARAALLPLPHGDGAPTAQVGLVNPASAPQVVTVTPVLADGTAGAVVPVTVPADAAAEVPVPAGAVGLRIEAPEGVLAGATLTAQAGDGTLIAALPATQGAADRGTVGVRTLP